MPTIAVMDLETTGLDTLNDRITDVGVILYNSESNRIVKKYSTLVQQENVPDDITKLTNITVELLNKFGIAEYYAVKYLMKVIDEADYVLAHNGTNFDFPMLENSLVRMGLPSLNKPRIDSCVDFPYPVNIKTRKLSYLMAEHGLAIQQPAHQAITDAESLLQLMLKYDINEIIERSLEENVVVRAIVHKDDNYLVKNLGFRWTNKKWVKTVKRSEVEMIRQECSFPVV